MIDGELYQTFTSVENLPGLNSRAVFEVNSAGVFREAGDIAPQPCPGGKVMYMPWGADNMMPYDILDLIERDETLTTCQTVNAETLYAAGLHYDASAADGRVRDEVGAFALDNNLISLTMGMCSDMKYFGFAIALNPFKTAPFFFVLRPKFNLPGFFKYKKPLPQIHGTGAVKSYTCGTTQIRL